MHILFPHSTDISELVDISWVQAKIRPSEAVLKPDLPWEITRTNLYGSVIKRNGQYEMFYQCGNAIRLARAVSIDGLVWEKELVTTADFSNESVSPFLQRSSDRNSQSEQDDVREKTNIVAACHMPTVVYREDDERPYKLFAFGREGYATFDSDDGKFFESIADPAIELLVHKNDHTGKGWGSDVGPCYIDGEDYVSMTKTYTDDDQNRTRRCVGRAVSRDFRTWSEVETLWVPNESDDAIAQARGFKWADFYGLCPFKYGDGYLAFLWLFEIEKELPHGTNLGKIEVFLATSPDGISWERVSDQAFIPWDLNFGTDGGMVTTASAPLFDEQEIKIYYSDSNFEHGYHEKDFDKVIEQPTWDIRCAQLPKERLVGAYSQKGKLLVFTGALESKMLRLNADTHGGKLLVRYRNCGEFLGEHEVEEIDDTDIYIEPLSGEANELEICLHDATLYAIEVIHN